MRENNLSSWKYNSDMECMLFFAQRLDEMLFHHSTDTYRCRAYTVHSLAVEYCRVYEDVKTGIINQQNLNHIISEFSKALQEDPVAQEILSSEYVEKFQKGYGAWNIDTQKENLVFIARKLGNRTYYKKLVEKLIKTITQNTSKQEVNAYANSFLRELLDYGYDENYVYHSLHEIFFHNEVSSFDALNNFFEKFSFESYKYDVYIGYSYDISPIFPLFKNLKVSDLEVYLVKDIPDGIKKKNQKSIICFKEIESLDAYSAYEVANAISNCVVNSYSYFKHDKNTIHQYGQVVIGSQITTIHKKDLLKYRVSSLSHEESTKGAESLIGVLFDKFINFSDFFKYVEIHNTALQAENCSDSLLSLWSILEAQAEENKDTRSKIGSVISITVPFLKSTYIHKLVGTCMEDIKRWNPSFFSTHIANNSFGNNDIEHTFAFLAFEDMQSDRDLLFSKTTLFPLLKNRVYELHDQLHNSKKIKALLAAHCQRIEWHLYRIYRARNYIIHDGARSKNTDRELVINLHTYVDTMLNKIIELVHTSPYDDSIKDAILSHKMATSIIDDNLENQSKESITKDNALKYLYYDFEK